MTVYRICSRDVDVCEASESVRAIAERMHDRNVGCLVVVGGAEKPIGIVTDRDIVVRVVAPGHDPATTHVREIMTARPVTVAEGTEVQAALALMRSGPYRRLPVVDGHGALVGLVSIDDVLSAMSGEFAQIGDVVRREGPGALAAS